MDYSSLAILHRLRASLGHGLEVEEGVVDFQLPQGVLGVHDPLGAVFWTDEKRHIADWVEFQELEWDKLSKLGTSGRSPYSPSSHLS